MTHSRRTIIAAGATGLTSLAAAGTTRAAPDLAQPPIKELVRRSERANAALMGGDIATYLDLITVSDDFTLMSPFGGKPSQGAYSCEQWDQIGKFFKNGTLRQELVQAYGSRDMVVLAVIEHCEGEVGGLPPQEWRLRVTLVYRRHHDQWLLVHRHADPLANGISVEQSAALARGSKDV